MYSLFQDLSWNQLLAVQRGGLNSASENINFTPQNYEYMNILTSPRSLSASLFLFSASCLRPASWSRLHLEASLKTKASKGNEFLPQILCFLTYILATRFSRPLIFQTMNSVGLNRFTSSGCKDIGLSKFELVAKTQILYLEQIQHYLFTPKMFTFVTYTCWLMLQCRYFLK